MKKVIKIVIAIVVILGIAAAGLFFWKKKGGSIKQESNQETIYQVTRETYENVIEVSGTVSAAKQQSLQALGSGTVVGVYAKKGDKVHKGDVIIQLDDSDEVYNLEKHDFNMATTRLNGSPRELELMETQRKSLVQKIADRKVVATFDGVIVDLKTEVGSSVKAAETIGTLVNIDYLTADVEIAETDVAKLEVGQPVIIEFSASKKGARGYVTGWPAIGEITNRGATIVKANIRIDEYPEEILPNYSFTGKIQIEEPVDNIIVSRYAIGYEEDGSAYVIMARTGEKVPVKVTQYGRENVKVLTGLKGNERLQQATEPAKSGQNKDRTNTRTNGNNQQGQGNSNGNTSGANARGNQGMGGNMPTGNFGGGFPGR